MDDIYIRKWNVRVGLEWKCLGFVSCGRFGIGFRSNNAAVTSEFCPVTASVLVGVQNENMMAG
jgi:predicted membrane protein